MSGSNRKMRTENGQGPERNPTIEQKRSRTEVGKNSTRDPYYEKKQMRGLTIGIDLGTTYSSVGIFRDGHVQIIPNECGNTKTPSCIAFTDDGILIGEAAVHQANLNPINTVFDFKRLIGRKFEKFIWRLKWEHCPFKVIAGEGGEPQVEIDSNGETTTFTAEQLTAMVLKKMKETAESFIGGPVTNAVIAGPSIFNASQRRVIKNAASLAGLNVLRIVKESPAAALAYGFHNQEREEHFVLVVANGGGFMDVSIHNIKDGIIEVKSVAGSDLGGVEFDNFIVNDLVLEFKRKHKKASIELDFLFEGIDFYTSLSRARFEDFLFEGEVLFRVKQALREAKIDKSSIHDVILVGGSTRIPKIQKLLADFFEGHVLNTTIDSDQAVACGAAILAANLAGDQNLDTLAFFDVAPITIGIENAGAMTSLVERNSSIPTKSSKTFPKTSFALSRTTANHGDEPGVMIKIVEGKIDITSNNTLLGLFEIPGGPPALDGIPEIEVTLDILPNNDLCVTAVDKTTGNRAVARY